MPRFVLRALCLCLFAANASGAGDTLADIRALRADMLSLQGAQVPAAIAKGEAALALLETTRDTDLELSLAADVAWLQMQNGNVPLALKTVGRGLALAKAKRDLPAQRKFRVMQAAIGMNLGSPAATAAQAMAVLKEAEAAGDTQNTIDALRVLSQAEMASGDFIQSLVNLHQGLDLAEKIKSPVSQHLLLFMLSNYYIHTQDWPKALATNKESFALAGSLGDKYRQATLLLNRSSIYGGMNLPEEELATLRQAQTLALATGNNHVSLSAEINLSDTLFHRKDYAGALKAADHGLALARQMGMQARAAVALVNRGMALNRLGQHALGLAVMAEGVELMQSSGSTVVAAGALGDLSDEYAFAGDYRSALKYQKSFKERSDQLHNDARSKTLQQLESRYQSEKQEKTILALTAENDRRSLVRNFSIMGAVLGLALAAAILARYRLLRRSSGQLKLLNDKLQSQAVTDPLTGLHNRRFFLENVGQYMAWTDRIRHPQDAAQGSDVNKDLVFFMIDLDHFKHVNDTYGHNAGDLVLTQAVERLRGAIRLSDELVRWGGEEFLLVARQTSRQQAPWMAERLRQAVAAGPFDLGEGRFIERTCSIGFAAYPLLVGAPLQPAWETIVDLADQALYVAKSSGRNGWVGVLGKETDAADGQLPAIPSDLRTLVDDVHCRLVCSLPDPAALVWASHP
jgi:diguanylate cyclase (GGDEF)-like protein